MGALYWLKWNHFIGTRMRTVSVAAIGVSLWNLLVPDITISLAFFEISNQ
jgi:hypothetical protein